MSRITPIDYMKKTSAGIPTNVNDAIMLGYCTGPGATALQRTVDNVRDVVNQKLCILHQMAQIDGNEKMAKKIMDIKSELFPETEPPKEGA